MKDLADNQGNTCRKGTLPLKWKGSYIYGVRNYVAETNKASYSIWRTGNTWEAVRSTARQSRNRFVSGCRTLSEAQFTCDLWASFEFEDL